MDDLLIILGSAAAAFTAGILVASAILLCRTGRRLFQSRRPFVVDDEWKHSPWRDM
jgi:hypothetical protein